MISCLVCHTENDKYTTICKKCGSFLQNRVPNLDLFDTIWKIIENPRKAFKSIMLAEHKNYSLFLYVLLGICFTFYGFWYFKIGDRFQNLLSLIFWGLLIGIPAGCILCPIVSFFHRILSRFLGGQATFRNSLGITSYAMIPFIFSLVFILPIELMTFGMYFFSFNPHPMAINPISYSILIGLNGVMMIWAFILLIIGTVVGNQIKLWKSIVIVIMLCVVILRFVFSSGEYILSLL
jgi:hypothetical protein